MSVQTAVLGVASTGALALAATAAARMRSGGEICLPGSLASRFRINLTYLFRHGRLPNLITPRGFTELVQVRKMMDRDPRLPIFADKVLVKNFVADRLGDDWVIPTLWQGRTLPTAPEWLSPFVVKSRHGCNQHVFVRSDRVDWSSITRRCERWMAQRYGFWLDEWLYGEIEPGILVEPFVGSAGVVPIDYKFFVFGGRVEFVQVHLDREHRHRWVVFDRSWRRITPGPQDLGLSPPTSLPRMMEAAETLARGFDFVRVDMYQIKGRPLFGEMTFYPGSGLDPFDPPSLDFDMGAYWNAATRARLAVCR